MRLAARARTCLACGGREPRDARWCGDCGAPLADVDAAVRGRGRVDTPPRDPRVSRASRRSMGAAGVVLGAMVLGLLAVPAPEVDRTLLGRLDDATGRSSLVAPVDDLQLLWRRTVDAPHTDPVDVPTVAELEGVAVLLDDEVVDGDRTLRLRTGPVRADDRGRVLVVADGVALLADATTGVVRRRATLTGDWLPQGASLGWVAGAAVLVDADGVLGAVGPDGRVRWVGERTWSWDGAGHGTEWLVVTATEGSSRRVLVVDGRTGEVHRDVGPLAAVHAPVVHGDVLVHVDPVAGVDRGLGHPVEVRGLLLDGSGRTWTATDLPPTAGTPTAVAVTPVADGVAVHYWTAGHASTATWFDPTTGRRLGEVSVSGSGRTDEGWPVTAVVGDAIAHVDPVRDSIRLVDRRGTVRWSIRALHGEGLLADGGTIVVRTPPRGTSLQSRVRVLDAGSGRTQWDLVTDDVQEQRIVGVLDGHVGIGGTHWPTPLRRQSWLALDTGRRRSGTGLAADALASPVDAGSDIALLGLVADGTGTRPVFVLPDGAGPGRVVGLDPRADAGRTTAGLPAGPSGSGDAKGTVADQDLDVAVTAAGVRARDPATGRERWSVASEVLLRPDLAVLLDEVVVTVGVDGRLRARARDDGSLRWTGPPAVVTALTAGGEVLVAGTLTGDVLLLDADGTPRARIDAGDAAVEDVAVVDGRVVVAVGADAVAFGRGAAFVEPVDRVEVP